MMGATEMIATLRRFKDKYPDRIAAVLYQIAQEMMTEAKRRCPVASDGGILRSSGMVSDPVREGRRISVTLSFGGGAIAYAIAVHETISEHDPPSWKKMYENGGMIQWTSQGTGDHFLSSVIDEWMPTMNARMATRLHLDKGAE